MVSAIVHGDLVQFGEYNLPGCAMKTASWQADLQQSSAICDRSICRCQQHHWLLQNLCLRPEGHGEVVAPSPFNRNQYLYLLLQGQLKVYLGSLDSQAVSTLTVGDRAWRNQPLSTRSPLRLCSGDGSPGCALRFCTRESLFKLFQQS
jgi:hypothetical protein